MTKKLMKIAVLTAGLLSAVPLAHAGAWSTIGTTMESYDPEGKSLIGCGALLAGTAVGLIALHNLGLKKKKAESYWFNHYCAAIRDNTVAIASAALAYAGISRFVAMYNGQPIVAAQPASVTPSIVNVTVQNAQVTMPAMVPAPAPVYTEPVQHVLFKGFPRIHKTELYQTMKQKTADFFTGPAPIEVEARFEAPVTAQTVAQAPVVEAPGMFAKATNLVRSSWNSLSPNTQTGVMVGAAAATLVTGAYAYKKYADYKHMKHVAITEAQQLAAQRNAVAQAQRLQRQAERRRALGLPEQRPAPHMQLHLVIPANNRPDIRALPQVNNGGPAIR